jgi:hypothetical protein
MGRGENSQRGAFWTAHFMEVCSVESVFVVQRCLAALDVPAKEVAGVYASLDGAVDALERDAAAAGAEFVCDPGDDAWRVWIGREEFVIHEEPVRK